MKFQSLLFCLILIQGIATAQTKNVNLPATVPVLKKDYTFQKGYFPTLLSNLGQQATAIGRIKKTDVPWLIGGTVSTFFLFSRDASVEKSFRNLKSQNNTVRIWSPRITNFGGASGFYLVGATTVTGLLFKDDKLLHTSLLASQAMITSGLWVRVIKMISSRPRPSFFYDHTNAPAMKWYEPFKEFDTDTYKLYPQSAFDAFPSGHTATAFSIASVFAMEYRDKPLIPILAYTGAGLVGISRLSEHAHWSSDILVGACLGYLCAKQIVHNDRLSNTATVSNFHKKKYSIFYSVYPSLGSLNGQISVVL